MIVSTTLGSTHLPKVETREEYLWLAKKGALLQGYLSAKSAFESLRVLHYLESS
jgi:hypothetical protein